MSKLENLTTKLKNITSSLHKIVECPICLDTIKVPFKVCGRGHGICNDCCGGLEKCPTCQDTFSMENPICLKNLLEALPRQCCYSDEGCEEIVEPESDHEMYCGYRPILCRVKECQIKVPLVKLTDHCRRDHPEEDICKDKQSLISYSKFDQNKGGYGYTLFTLFDNLFWILLVCDPEDKNLRIFFQGTPIGKPKNDCYAKITFEDKQFNYTSTIKASTLSSCVTKFGYRDQDEDEGKDKMSKEDLNVDEESCMKIPRSKLRYFITENKVLIFRLVFFESN